jgi:hypothetical protein
MKTSFNSIVTVPNHYYNKRVIMLKNDVANLVTVLVSLPLRLALLPPVFPLLVSGLGPKSQSAERPKKFKQTMVRYQAKLCCVTAYKAKLSKSVF